MKFINKKTNKVEEIPDFAWLWPLLFGVFFLLKKGIWRHALVYIALVILTSAFGYGSWSLLGVMTLVIIYPLCAQGILEEDYLRRGWEEVPEVVEGVVGGNETE